MTISNGRLVKARADVVEHRKWIAAHGGNLAGYIMRYGSKNDPEHYGDGGEAIYQADLAALHRAESLLSHLTGIEIRS